MDDLILQTIKNKLEEENFSPQDIPAYLKILCDIGNQVEDMQEEVEDWDKTIQLVISDLGEYYLHIEDGKFSFHDGKAETPDFTLTMKPEDAAKILTGQKDPKLAYFTGALKVDGNINDAIRIESLIEIVMDELEE